MPGDILNSKVVATVNVGVTPTGMVIAPGNKLYVANGNNYGIPGSDSVTVIDLNFFIPPFPPLPPPPFMPIETISDSTFNQLYTLTLSEDGTKLYATNSDASTISIIDTGTNSVIGIIGGFNGPSGMVIKGTKAYVNNYGASTAVPSGFGNTVSVVDLVTTTIIKEISLSISSIQLLPTAPAAITISPDGNYVYTANYVTGEPGTGTVSKIDTGTDTLVGTYNVPDLFGAFSITIHSDGTKAYCTNFGSNNFAPYGTTVCVLDLATYETTLIEVGIQPAGFAITTDGRYGFVSNYNTLYSSGAPAFTGLTPGQGTVNIIDLDLNSVLPVTINVGSSPRAIVMSADGMYAAVSSYTANMVSIIQIGG